jgi:TrmH family RNA methyltransferase
MTITSPHNDKLKELRKLARKAERDQSRPPRFVAEGEDLVDAADAAGWPAVERLVAAGSGLEGTEVEPDLLAKASSLGSGTRVVGVYEQRWAGAPAGPLCVALHGVGDPGNVGTILRSALAFGAASVAVGPGCADPFGPKAVRASMGAIFHVPVARWDGAVAAGRAADGPQEKSASGGGAPARGLPAPTIALVARAGEPLRGPLAGGTLVVGAERHGLPDEVVSGCDRVAHLPIAAASESLNAAMAASIALYEATREDPE